MEQITRGAQNRQREEEEEEKHAHVEEREKQKMTQTVFFNKCSKSIWFSFIKIRVIGFHHRDQ